MEAEEDVQVEDHQEVDPGVGMEQDMNVEGDEEILDEELAMERKLVRKEAEGREQEESSIDQVLQSTGQGREGGLRAPTVSARQGRKRKADVLED